MADTPKTAAGTATYITRRRASGSTSSSRRIALQSSDDATRALRVGLCGWTIARSAYIRRFPLVEIQHTFYEPPTDVVLDRWRLEVPLGFEFTIKAWQLVTHQSTSPTYRRLRRSLPDEHRGQVGSFRSTPPVLQAWDRTLECARILGATAVLIQCPRSFRPSSDNIARMTTFLSTVARPAGRLLWEPHAQRDRDP